MSSTTGIEWTDATWNPVRGCSRVSEGCRHCYAERVAARFSGAGLPYEGLARQRSNGEAQWTGELRLIPKHLSDPLRWQQPKRIFVNSMSDLFHEKLTNEEIAQVFAVMALAPQHTFQILTKRPERMRDWFKWVVEVWPQLDPQHEQLEPDSNIVLHYGPHDDPRFARALDEVADDFAAQWPLPNVWLGVSVEDQAAADERIPLLLETPAAVRFLSCEPLLGPLDLSAYMGCTPNITGEQIEHYSALDWVIVGGESGGGARACNLDWIWELVRQCGNAQVACFVKQLGAVPTATSMDAESGDDVEVSVVLHDRKGGNIEEWPHYLRVREFPAQGVAA